MKSLRATLSGRHSSQVRHLGDEDLPEALALCLIDPIAAVLATTRLEAAQVDGLARSGGQLWGFPSVGPLQAVCWSGANLVPVIPSMDIEILKAFADEARRQGRRCSSIVGKADAVLGLWSRLEENWSTPRGIRSNQPSMVITGDPHVESAPDVRYSSMADFPDLLPACVDMFEEEVGYSPMTYSARAYEERVRGLVVQRRSMLSRVSEPSGEIVFKAEIGALTRDVAQIQGVWVNPRHRGRGHAAPGMAAVVRAAQRDAAQCVSLYVNNYNARALATYRTVGFEQVGTFATVLF